MQKAASADNINIFICSAFRDYIYQANLIKKKLFNGIDINNITKILAAPGFSEHHTGCAIDIISPPMKELDDTFEKTDAFNWLTQNACLYNFSMTYPRNNPSGIMFEPWHWCFRPD